MSELPPLRRRAGLVTRIGSRLSTGIAEVEATREPRAHWWDQANAAALREDGPLWLVLGDSLSQGIGSSEPESGFVPRVAERLRHATGAPWRVLNLSITGAQIPDVLDRQLPVHADLGIPPALTTCLIGANDVLLPVGVRTASRLAHRLTRRLPIGTLVGRVGSGPLSRAKATAINRALDRAEREGRITTFDPWAWPSRHGTLAVDRFHPNDRGYEHLATTVWRAVAAHLALAP